MTRPTSPKLEALRASLSKAIDARHEREIEDDIRREEEHLRMCPFIADDSSLRANLAEYDRKLQAADRFEIAAADLLGLPKHSGQEAILKAIRDLKTTAEKTPLLFGGLGFAAAGRDMVLEINIDNLLDAHKTPRRYEDGSLLTRAERIEWLGRRAPKT